jgi:NADPH-dependent glutamate synthase beta subunit-like oxidoreductase
LKKRREKVLVVGSGPAGLTAANDLTLLGFKVTIFEALPILGGMLAVGIPEFRLPREILRMEIDGIRGLGVDMIPNRPFHLDDHGKRFRKWVIMPFFSRSEPIAAKVKYSRGETKGVFPGVEFLRDLNLGKKPGLGKEVAVIGGGNVAVDVAHSSLLLGAKKVSIFIEDRKRKCQRSLKKWRKPSERGFRSIFLPPP